MKLKLNY